MNNKKIALVVAALIIVEVLVCVLFFAGNGEKAAPAVAQATSHTSTVVSVEMPAEEAIVPEAAPEAAPEVAPEAAPEVAPAADDAAVEGTLKNAFSFVLPADMEIIETETAPAVEPEMVVLPEGETSAIVGDWMYNGMLLCRFGEDGIAVISVPAFESQNEEYAYVYENDVLTFVHSGIAYGCVIEGDQMILTETVDENQEAHVLVKE